MRFRYSRTGDLRRTKPSMPPVYMVLNANRRRMARIAREKQRKRHGQQLVNNAIQGQIKWYRRNQLRAEREAEKLAFERSRKLALFKSNARFFLDNSVSVLRILLLTLLCLNILRMVFQPESNYFTFANFLNMLQNVPVISLDWITKMSNFSINFPSWLGWLSPFVGLIVTAGQLLMYLCTGFLQCLAYIWYFFDYIFALGV